MSAVPDVFGGAYAAILASKAAGIHIKSIQYGSITTSGGSGTATITSVNTARAACLYLGFTSSDANAATNKNCGASVTLTNATTVTASYGDTGRAATVNYCVVEFY